MCIRDSIKAAVTPTEIILVVDAMTGQDAVTVSQTFDQALGINGVLTVSYTHLDVYKRQGLYRGTLDGVSHQQVVDVFRKDAPGFSVKRFYISLARGLAEKGL